MHRRTLIERMLHINSKGNTSTVIAILSLANIIPLESWPFFDQSDLFILLFSNTF
jgi:hypothetical protein